MTTETLDDAARVPVGPREWRWRLVCCALGLTPVGPLVFWMEGLGPFWIWWIAVTVPCLLALAVIAAWPGFLRSHRRVRAALITGTIGGIVGTLGYDLFRVPFVVGGLRLFSPISSFGILMLDASHSSPATEFLGWMMHFLDGVGFAIAFAMLFLGRRWWWGPLWGVFLESMTLLTPYTSTYNLKGHWDLIGIALAAHVAYGAPIGYFVSDGDAWADRFDEVSRRLAPFGIAACVVVVAVWLTPWNGSDDHRTASERSAGVAIVISEGRFEPEWTRIAVGDCVLVANHDDAAHKQIGSVTKLDVEAGETAKMCFDKAAIYRIKLEDLPYSGGFVLVDAEE